MLSKDFVISCLNYLTDTSLKSYNCNLIRKNTEHLIKSGDFYFPLDKCVWENYVEQENEQHDEHFKGKIENLTLISENWKLQVQHTKLQNNRCLLFINRLNSFKSVSNLFENDKFFGYPSKEIYINLIEENQDFNELAITNYRLNLIKIIIKNLQQYTKYQIFDNDSEEHSNKILLTTKSNYRDHDDLKKIILCGIVYDPKENSKKITNILAQDYIKKRSIDMQLMSQHKYGIRVKNEQFFIDLIDRLGHAAVTVDLIEVKHSSSVGLATIAGYSSSKGASFILYNSARIETLFRLYDERVKSGYYPALPNVNEIDFSLLKEEEEWQLLFNYVLEFHSLVERSIGDLENGNIHLHLICNYLCGLIGIFSVYYRRCKILTENRPKLLPTMFARIYLLKYLRIVFNRVLKILDIDPIVQM